MWIFGPALNKVTIYYVVLALALSGLLKSVITVTNTHSEAFFVILATLDLCYRTWKVISNDYHLFHGDSVSEGVMNNIKRILTPWLNPLEGAHILFIPSWCVSLIFIGILRMVAA